MTRLTSLEQQAINKECLQDPQPGDYWKEHLKPICVVVSVGEDSVAICEKHKPDGIHWAFNCLRSLPKDMFKKMLQYGSDNTKTWADVHPRAYDEQVERY